MGFLEKSLGKNEVIVQRARIHWLWSAYYWLWLILAEGVLIWVRLSFPNVIILPVFFGLSAIFVLLFLRYMIPIWAIEIGLTNYRIIFKRGWISRASDELGLHVIEEVNLTQSVWGRLFDFGTLFVHGTGDDKLAIERISNPLSFRRAIETARENAVLSSAQPKG